MTYREAGNLPPNVPSGAKIGPLTPYQRPLVLLLFIAIPFAVSALVGWFLLESEWFQQRWKKNKHSAGEVKFNTIETATTANEVLLQLITAVQEFDRRSRELFHEDHHWIVDGQRAETPEYIYRFIQEQRDMKFLERYVALSVARVEFESRLEHLERQVDNAVQRLPEDATPERVFRAQRFLRREITQAATELDRQRQNLESLGTQFNSENQ